MLDENAESMQTKRVNLTQLARLSGVSRQTLYRWMDAGRLPPGVEALPDAPGADRFRVHVPTLNRYRAERQPTRARSTT